MGYLTNYEIKALTTDEKVSEDIKNITVLVSGGRDYTNWNRVNETLTSIHKEAPIGKIVHGGAKGADSLGGKWARENGVVEKIYKADWETHGKAAGSIRNQQMLDSNTVELVVAFPGGKGTSDMVSRAKKSGIEVKEIQNE